MASFVTDSTSAGYQSPSSSYCAYTFFPTNRCKAAIRGLILDALSPRPPLRGDASGRGDGGPPSRFAKNCAKAALSIVALPRLGADGGRGGSGGSSMRLGTNNSGFPRCAMTGDRNPTALTILPELSPSDANALDEFVRVSFTFLTTSAPVKTRSYP